MSATQSPPVPPRPMPQSPVAGAVNGMPAQDPKAQMAAKFQSVIAGVKEVVSVIGGMPGADKAKVQQAVGMLTQAVQLLAEAIPKPGVAAVAGPGAASPGGAPPGGPV